MLVNKSSVRQSKRNSKKKQSSNLHNVESSKALSQIFRYKVSEVKLDTDGEGR